MKRLFLYYSRYCLVLFKPWDLVEMTPGPLNWNAMQAFLHECEFGSVHVGKFIGGVILQWITILADGLAPNESHKQISQAYR
jgi:hypothetical protein